MSGLFSFLDLVWEKDFLVRPTNNAHRNVWAAVQSLPAVHGLVSTSVNLMRLFTCYRQKYVGRNGKHLEIELSIQSGRKKKDGFEDYQICSEKTKTKLMEFSVDWSNHSRLNWQHFLETNLIFVIKEIAISKMTLSRPFCHDDLSTFACFDKLKSNILC